MDPMTHAAHAFLTEVKDFWLDHPERVLPLLASQAIGAEVVKALRLGEYAPGNRWPLFLYAEPFDNTKAYFDGLSTALAKDYEALRKGVADEGLVLPAFVLAEGSLDPMARAAFTMERVADLLGERFAGAMIALVPAQVSAGAEWRANVEVLAIARRSERLRLSIFAPEDGPLGDLLGEDGARFHVDPDDLLAFLKGIGDETARKDAGTEGGSASPNPQRRLRRLLLEAAEQGNAGKNEAAAKTLHAARALCDEHGLVAEEAMVWMSLAGTCLRVQRRDLAVEAYERAAGIARHAKAPELECSAWLGVGGARMAQKDFAAAVLAYRAAAMAAKQENLAVLRIEALRLAGTCSLRCNAEAAALELWKEALAVGTTLDGAEREATTFPEVARALAALVRRLGLPASAAHLELLPTLDPGGAPAIRSDDRQPADPLFATPVGMRGGTRLDATLGPVGLHAHGAVLPFKPSTPETQEAFEQQLSGTAVELSARADARVGGETLDASSMDIAAVLADLRAKGAVLPFVTPPSAVPAAIVEADSIAVQASSQMPSSHARVSDEPVSGVPLAMRCDTTVPPVSVDSGAPSVPLESPLPGAAAQCEGSPPRSGASPRLGRVGTETLELGSSVTAVPVGLLGATRLDTPVEPARPPAAESALPFTPSTFEQQLAATTGDLPKRMPPRVGGETVDASSTDIPAILANLRAKGVLPFVCAPSTKAATPVESVATTAGNAPLESWSEELVAIVPAGMRGLTKLEATIEPVAPPVSGPPLPFAPTSLETQRAFEQQIAAAAADTPVRVDTRVGGETVDSSSTDIAAIVANLRANGDLPLRTSPPSVPVADASRVLPSLPGSATLLPPQGAGPPPSHPHMAPVSERGRAAGPTSASPGAHQPLPAPPMLTLQQHASLCVELALGPDRVLQTLLRYGLSEQQRVVVDTYWRQQIAVDPAAHAAWQSTFVQYRDWINCRGTLG